MDFRSPEVHAGGQALQRRRLRTQVSASNRLCKELQIFCKSAADGYVAALPGIELKTLAHGDKTLMTEFVLKKGRQLPKHSHPHEQTGYLVRGHIRLAIGSEEFDVLPGDSWCIPGNIEHGAEIIEDSVAVEVFSPVREEYLPG